MGFPKPVTEIAIRTTAINNLVLKTADATADSLSIQRLLLHPFPRCFADTARVALYPLSPILRLLKRLKNGN